MMYGRIVGFAVCILCALPFYCLAMTGKRCETPLAFLLNSDALHDKIQNISAYNQAMARLYMLCAAAFTAAALGFLAFPLSGALILILVYTAGFYAAWRSYKNILLRHSF